MFTEDAVIDFRDLSAQPPRGLAPIVGRAEIVRQFRDVLTHPYQHMLVNHVIEDVSPDEVVVRSKALLPLPGGSVADIVYRDTVVRTPDGWRISAKSTKRYNFDPPASGAWSRPRSGYRGARSSPSRRRASAGSRTMARWRTQSGSGEQTPPTHQTRRGCCCPKGAAT